MTSTFAVSRSAVEVAAGLLIPDRDQIGRNHLLYQCVEASLVPPSKLGPSLGRVAEQGVDLGWAKVPRVDLNKHLSISSIDTLLFDAGGAPDDGPTDLGKRPCHELAD